MTSLQLFNPLLPFKIALTHRSLLSRLTRRQIAARYRGSMLGYFWSLSHPLLMLAVYSFVFGVIFKARWGTELGDGSGNFAIIMFCGMAVFNIFSETVNGSAHCIIGNPNFVKKVIFPLEILPMVQLLSTSILGMIWFGLVLAGAWALGMRPSWTVLMLPLLLGPLMLCALGAAYVVSATTVYFRDMPHLVGIATQILFFMTPIFYPEHLVPERLRFILQCNPLTSLVSQTREVLLFGRPPDWQVCALLWLLSFCICQLGLAWFLKTKRGFADVL